MEQKESICVSRAHGDMDGNQLKTCPATAIGERKRTFYFGDKPGELTPSEPFYLLFSALFLS